MRKTYVRMLSTNRQQLVAKLYQKFENLQQASEEVMLDEAVQTLAESLQEVPRDTGALASIAEIAPTHNTKTTMSIKIGYGLTKDAYNEKSRILASQYMRKVHEDLDAKHPNGGKAKFLEDPVNRARIRIADRLKVVGRSVLK